MSENRIEGWSAKRPDCYVRELGGNDRAVISQYGEDFPNHVGQWHYIVYRANGDISGIVKTLDEAKSVADELIEISISNFVRRQADKIVVEIRKLHERLIEIGAGDDIQGFSDGFKVGYIQALTEIVTAAKDRLSDRYSEERRAA